MAIPKSSSAKWIPSCLSSAIRPMTASASSCSRFFGHFQLQALGRGTGFGQQSAQLLGKAGLPELPDMTLTASVSLAVAGCCRLPGRQLPASGGEHPAAERNDQAGFLGQVDEAGRQHHAPDRVHPAQQGLGTDRVSGGIHLQLVMQLGALLVDRTAQLGFERGARRRGRLHSTGSKKRSVLRPAALAWYMAVSARRNSSSAVTLTPSKSAIPMLDEAGGKIDWTRIGQAGRVKSWFQHLGGYSHRSARPGWSHPACHRCLRG